ncbi:hypothetical protein PHISP_03375 [Aspergillus sp. HF37]|nr:hypothetical protein PHISP_03375 [Aspergillus sp. HF37]
MDGHVDAGLPSRIAALAHAHFNALPRRSKPVVRPDTREWTPMSSIVVVRGENTPTESLTCVSIATGAKCLAASQIPRCRGLVLHDCHAEILALRAFNYWLITECRSILAHGQASTEGPSPFVRRRRTENSGSPSKNASPPPGPLFPPLELHPDVTIYLYCTCAPCGDASMELCMAAQEDATPWAIPPDASDADADADSLLDGRAHFSRLGVVRRKPARTDAEVTRSKSCSDKLSLREVASLLSLETSLLVAPSASAYLAGLILPEGEISRDGCERAFGGSGRMGSLAGLAWPGGGDVEGTSGHYCYGFRPFRVLSIPTALLEELWAFGKPAPQERSGDIPRKSKPGVVSAIWACAPSGLDPVPQENGSRILPSLRGSRTGLYENIINGVRQGNRASSPSPRGASGLSRAKLWGLLREVLLVSSGPAEKRDPGSRSDCAIHDGKEAGDTRGRALEASTYYGFKQASLGARSNAIHNARKTLKGWTRNWGDEDWGLEVLIDSEEEKA